MMVLGRSPCKVRTRHQRTQRCAPTSERRPTWSPVGPHSSHRRTVSTPSPERESCPASESGGGCTSTFGRWKRGSTGVARRCRVGGGGLRSSGRSGLALLRAQGGWRHTEPRERGDGELRPIDIGDGGGAPLVFLSGVVRDLTCGRLSPGFRSQSGGATVAKAPPRPPATSAISAGIPSSLVHPVLSSTIPLCGAGRASFATLATEPRSLSAGGPTAARGGPQSTGSGFNIEVNRLRTEALALVMDSCARFPTFRGP